MGVCAEEGFSPECQFITVKAQSDSSNNIPIKPVSSLQRNKPDYSESLMTFSQNNKPERLLIVGLILVIIGLTAALVTVISCRTCNKVNEIEIQKSAPCEDDWIWYRGKCYYFSTERDTWNNSEKFCHSHESSLAIIDDKEELDFLIRHKDTYNHWIGVRRTDDNTGWTWTNGTLYNENLFRITRQSEHSGEIEFVFLNHEGVKSQEGIYDYKWICNRT